MISSEEFEVLPLSEDSSEESVVNHENLEEESRLEETLAPEVHAGAAMEETPKPVETVKEVRVRAPKPEKRKPRNLLKFVR